MINIETTSIKQAYSLIGLDSDGFEISAITFSDDKHDAGNRALKFLNVRENVLTSKSHSNSIAVAVCVKPVENICGIGVDYEGFRNLEINARRMFLSKNEIERFEPHEPKELIKLWTIKEALFKACPNNDNLFLRSFEITKLDENSSQAICELRPDYAFDFLVQPFENGFLSVALCRL